MILDILIAVALILAVMRGWFKGAATMVLSLVVFAGSALIAALVAKPMGSMMTFGSEFLRPVIAFFVIFICLMVIGRVLKKSFKPMDGVLGILDRLLGAALAGVRALFLLSLVFVFFAMLHFPSQPVRERSRWYNKVLGTAPEVIGFLVPALHEGTA